jgi:agmatine/peptidylarginine deiminase
MPAEWEPQWGVMLTWPHEGTAWSGELETVYALWARLTATIARLEPVLAVCRDLAHRDLVRERALQAGTPPERLRLVLAPSDDSWARDHGPISVLDSDGPVLLGFEFNGWGQKYPHAQDAAIARTLDAQGVFGPRPLEPGGMVLEGGAVETDGQGTLLAVERTLVDPLRNPGRSRAELELELGERLGIRRFLWLRNGQISGDDTDGHIDTLARFCDPRTICYVRGEDPQDPDYPGLKAMEEELRAFHDPWGEPYRLVPLPSPARILETQGPNRGGRLPAGYANFLILDRAVLVPVYDDPADAEALAILGELFPGREILSLDCRPLIRRGGSLHCVTMQLPAGLEVRV